MSLSNLKNEVFTIINQIPECQDTATKKEWQKTTLFHCGKKDGLYDKSTGTMIYKANTWTAFIYDWTKYKPPLWLDGGFYSLSADEKSLHFTVNAGDLLIFSDIPDAVPSTLQEFNALRDKYKYNGGIITGQEVYINFRPDGKPWQTNHIEIIKG